MPVDNPAFSISDWDPAWGDGQDTPRLVTDAVQAAVNRALKEVDRSWEDDLEPTVIKETK